MRRDLPQLFEPPTPERLAPVYYLYGAERLEVDRAVQAIRAAAHPGGGADLATDQFDLREAQKGKEAVPAIVDACRTLPFLAARRLVLVRGADTIDAEAAGGLLGYLADPAPTTCLVLVGGEKVDARTKLAQRLKAGGWLWGFDPPRGAGVAQFVDAEAARRGVRLDPDARRLLTDSLGEDSAELASAIDRLALYVAPEKRVTAQAVDEAIVSTRRRNVFELLAAVGNAQVEASLRCLAQLDRSEAPVKVVVMLARQVRQLLLVQVLDARRAPEGEVAKRVGAPPWLLQKLRDQARNFDAAGLRRSLALLAEADRTLKSSRLDDDLVLDRLIVALCSLKRKPAARRA